MSVLLAERRDDSVAVVTLNRPEKRNARSIELREALRLGVVGEVDSGPFEREYQELREALLGDG